MNYKTIAEFAARVFDLKSQLERERADTLGKRYNHVHYPNVPTSFTSMYQALVYVRNLEEELRICQSELDAIRGYKDKTMTVQEKLDLDAINSIILTCTKSIDEHLVPPSPPNTIGTQ